MKNNDKFFKKATERINQKIEIKSGRNFSFNYFRFHLKIHFYRLYYPILNWFSDRDFHDGFVISFILHLIFILSIIIYAVIYSKFYLGYNNKLKQEKVIIFDLNTLKIDKKNSLPQKKSTVKSGNKSKIKQSNNILKNNIKSNNVNLTNILKAKNDKLHKSYQKKMKEERDIKFKKSNIESIQNDLLVNVKKGIKAESIEDIHIPAGIDSKNDNKDELQISYINAVKFRVQNCWNIDAGIKGIQNIIVKIRVNLFETGYVQNIDILNLGDYNNSTEFNIVADSARRAIVSCAPYKFAIERYSYWKTINFNFYPDRRSIE